MLSDDLQNLRDVDVLTITVPPSLLAVVTGEEQDLRTSGRTCSISITSGCEHCGQFISSRHREGGHMVRPSGPYNNASSWRSRPT